MAIKNLVLSLSHFFLEAKNESLPDWFTHSLTLSVFKDRFEDPAFTNYVYLKETTIIGYISIKNKSHIYHLFVAEEFQGKGIANKLWSHVKSQLPPVTYSVRSSIFAIPVYESFGFKVIGEASTKDGIRFQNMEKLK